MSVSIVTGSSGLIGSQTCKFLSEQGLEVVGIDNNLREYFFGKDGSTLWNLEVMKKSIPRFSHFPLDIRDQEGMFSLFKKFGKSLELVVHTAAQPSHDWAVREPFMDFSVNAQGTLVMLEALRRYSPQAVFIFTSTNKVYGDRPNQLPLVETPTRWEIESTHPYWARGIDEGMSIDQSKHSLFGASKAAADLMVQEYGRYFGLKTGVFRGGCLTGPAHSAAKLHGFLAYLVKCLVDQIPYTIFGYKGKQVRDNIHSFDLVSAFWHFYQKPHPGEVYNLGGGRTSNCSMLEAITLAEKISGLKLQYTLSDEARSGDHVWWISDVSKFQGHFPGWAYRYDLQRIMEEIVAAARERARSQ
jgi:CDP-paratose 2-epimerase